MTTSCEDPVNEAKAETEQAGVEEEHDAPERGEAGHVPGAKLLALGIQEYEAAGALPGKGALALGGRGARAARSLEEVGNTNVASTEGGTNLWREQGYGVG